MNRTFTLVVGILVGSYAQQSLAWDCVTVTKISYIEAWINGIWNLAAEAPICCQNQANNSGNPVSGNNNIGVPDTGYGVEPAAEKIYSTLLAAFLANRPVRFYTNNKPAGTWGCGVGAINILK